MKKDRCDGIVLSALDEVAWVLNLRGQRLITKRNAHQFENPHKNLIFDLKIKNKLIFPFKDETLCYNTNEEY